MRLDALGLLLSGLAGQEEREKVGKMSSLMKYFVRVISNLVCAVLYEILFRKREEAESGEKVVSGEIYSMNHKSSCFRAISYAVCEERRVRERI